jgi:ribosomal protein S18
MPVKTRKLKSGKYRVSTPGGIKAKGTTKKKAKAQKRLLRAIKHNPKFKPRRRER